MRKSDVVVVGGSAAGITAAITCHRHYPDKSVLLVRKEQQVLIPCGIPYIFGTVNGPENDLIPDAVLSKNAIEFIVDEATGIDREAQTIETAGGETIGYVTQGVVENQGQNWTVNCSDSAGKTGFIDLSLCLSANPAVS